MMNIASIVAASIGGLVALFPLAFVAYVNGGGMYHLLKRRAVRKAALSVVKKAAGMACTIDTDCPPGHICVDGICVPGEA